MHLSRDILRTVMQDWISLKELGALNSSCCNTEFRSKLLDALVLKCVDQNSVMNDLMSIKLEINDVSDSLKHCYPISQFGESLSVMWKVIEKNSSDAGNLNRMHFIAPHISMTQLLQFPVRVTALDKSCWFVIWSVTDETAKHSDLLSIQRKTLFSDTRFGSTVAYTEGFTHNNVFVTKTNGIVNIISSDKENQIISTYMGQGLDDVPHGAGKYVSRYETYSGEWHKSQRHGQGECRYEDGAVYTGQWKHDEITSNGTMRYANGDEYCGQWLSGNRWGHGKMKFQKLNFVYEGNWEENYSINFGCLLWSSGDRLSGEWGDGDSHDWPSGKDCKLQLSNGDVYQGSFQRGFLGGYGVVEYENGDVFTCHFEPSKICRVCNSDLVRCVCRADIGQWFMHISNMVGILAKFGDPRNHERRYLQPTAWYPPSQHSITAQWKRGDQDRGYGWGKLSKNN
jgi:hypothetical protein